MPRLLEGAKLQVDRQEKAWEMRRLWPASRSLRVRAGVRWEKLAQNGANSGAAPEPAGATSGDAGRLAQLSRNRAGRPAERLQEAPRRPISQEALRRHGEAQRCHHGPALAADGHRDGADAPAPLLLVHRIATLAHERQLAQERR